KNSLVTKSPGDGKSIPFSFDSSTPQDDVEDPFCVATSTGTSESEPVHKPVRRRKTDKRRSVDSQTRPRLSRLSHTRKSSECTSIKDSKEIELSKSRAFEKEIHLPKELHSSPDNLLKHGDASIELIPDAGASLI